VVTDDPTRIRQVLLNLTSNAIKFTSEGHVLIEVTLAERHTDHRRLRFSVSDTGIRIPEEKQAMIFERFSQVDASTTRRFGGTSLGLAIWLDPARLMGGQIGATSSPGESTRLEFTISLPARWAAPATQPFRGTGVLVLDRRALSRSILEEMIAAWGASVSAVAGFAEAGPHERYQVVVAALGALPKGPSLPALPIPVLVLYGVSDHLQRMTEPPPGSGRTASVRPLLAPARSAELLAPCTPSCNNPCRRSRLAQVRRVP
jgi:hypothetical protein